MIRGYFSRAHGVNRPFIDVTLQFSTLGNRSIDVPLLVDSGADCTVLSPTDAAALVVFEATEGAPSMPSILGRDVLSRFALVLEERTHRVLLLEPEEADRVNWP